MWRRLLGRVDKLKQVNENKTSVCVQTSNENMPQGLYMDKWLHLYLHFSYIDNRRKASCTRVVPGTCRSSTCQGHHAWSRWSKVPVPLFQENVPMVRLDRQVSSQLAWSQRMPRVQLQQKFWPSGVLHQLQSGLTVDSSVELSVAELGFPPMKLGGLPPCAPLKWSPLTWPSVDATNSTQHRIITRPYKSRLCQERVYVAL